MGNKIFKIFCFVILLLVSCAENDGKIGVWYGMWQVTEIAIDGKADDAYTGNVVMKFQNDVMENQSQYAHNVRNFCYVKWWERDGYIFFEIPETTDNETQYGYVAELHLPWLPLIEMKIVNLDGKTATLEYNSGNGQFYTYFLKKLY